MKKRLWQFNQRPTQPQDGKGEAAPAEIIQIPPEPIRTYTDTNGRFIKIMAPNFAEGYEGQLSMLDLIKLQRERNDI